MNARGGLRAGMASLALLACALGLAAGPAAAQVPAPRLLASNSSTTLKATCNTGTTTNCARRSSGLSRKVSLPRFQVDTMISPW